MVFDVLKARGVLLFGQCRALLTAATTAASRASPEILPSNVLVEEEGIPDYDPKRFYPVNPGDLFHGRYEMVAKVGWGRSSTVWVARDTARHVWRWQSNRYVTVKVTVSDFVNQDAAKHELSMARRLETNPSHGGYPFMAARTCLVHEPMREPLWLFQRRWEAGKLPPTLLKIYLKFLLRGLDYLHSEYLKPDNILMGFEGPSVLEDFVREQAGHPMARKITDNRTIYVSRNDFGRLKSFRILPKIADFGLAECGDGCQPLRHPIQPPLFHAPEVLLGTNWTYNADIWNLGVLIWNLMENRDLFRNVRSSQGSYDSRAHMAEMIALLGPPPKALLDREKEWSEVKWSEVKWSDGISSPDGTLCQTPREYFKGPFFNSEGDFLYSQLIPNNISLSDLILSLEGEDKLLFLDFVGHMLQWLPERRKTAKELLEHPWLAS
ncbi:CMGC protein kinase [Lineolata rhizophorae]|uniref:CMGC protein kinase n=1 Tax=Lineolata rhizophorae TaxID=578093 RepID=A0A6A6NMZ3_9PEZI|nr:CMGC protein kinase [Lineolata rhizophorae]